jgi:hypothetical protein
MRKTREILRQKWLLKRPHRAISESVGASLGAVSLALSRAAEAKLTKEAVDALDDAELEARLYPSAAAVASRPEPDCSWIHRERHRVFEHVMGGLNRQVVRNDSRCDVLHAPRQHVEATGERGRAQPCVRERLDAPLRGDGGEAREFGQVQGVTCARGAVGLASGREFCESACVAGKGEVAGGFSVGREGEKLLVHTPKVGRPKP